MLYAIFGSLYERKVLFSYFHFMKYSIFAILAIASLVSTVSAATGSTSTSTGYTSTGIILPIAPVCIDICGGGGPARAYNFTTKQMDMVPQCFPWAWLLDFYKGNIFMIYENQKVCQKQRLIDFHM